MGWRGLRAQWREELLLAGHPYCQAWLRAEGLLMRRESPWNPAVLPGRDSWGPQTSVPSGSLLCYVSQPVV